MVNIIGLHYGHDATACLLRDGVVVYACAEERLSRVKFHHGFPVRALADCLRYGNLRMDEVDWFTFSFSEDTLYNLMHRYYVNEIMLTGDGSCEVFNRIPTGFRVAEAGYALLSPIKPLYHALLAANAAKVKKLFWKKMGELGIRRERCVFSDHHTNHAYSAYCTGGRERALVMVADAWGDDNHAGGLYTAVDGKIACIAQTRSAECSLGAFYGGITRHLGFRENRHEGKITGLAAFGDPRPAYDVMRRLITHDEQTLTFGRGVDAHDIYGAFPALARKYGQFRHLLNGQWAKSFYADYYERNLGKFTREEVAASAQKVLEDVVVEHVAAAVRKTGLTDIQLAGGVFANVKVNQRIYEIPGVTSVFIHPNMGDGGTALGAAYTKWVEILRQRGEKFTSVKLANVFFGPEYSEKEIGEAVQASGLTAVRHNDIAAVVAQHLADKKIVGWFNGRVEYGPRALGNRSLLADPTDRTINDWLNKRLKRTEFMPFAPSGMAEHAHEVYENYGPGADHAARYMTITFDVKKEWHDRIRAVVHVDGTARPQLVGPEDNPAYYAIMKEYRQRTGLPLFVNTSFNIHEEPIVCTPGDAIRSFVKGTSDILALGNFVITAAKP